MDEKLKKLGILFTKLYIAMLGLCFKNEKTANHASEKEKLRNTKLLCFVKFDCCCNLLSLILKKSYKSPKNCLIGN